MFHDVHWCHWGHFRPYTWPLKKFFLSQCLKSRSFFSLYYIHWTESEYVTSYKYSKIVPGSVPRCPLMPLSPFQALYMAFEKFFIFTMSEIWIGLFVILYQLNWIRKCNWLQIFQKLYQEVFPDVHWCHWAHFMPYTWSLKNFFIYYQYLRMAEIWIGLFFTLYPLNWIRKCNWLQIFWKLYQEVFPRCLLMPMRPFQALYMAFEKNFIIIMSENVWNLDRFFHYTISIELNQEM